MKKKKTQKKNNRKTSYKKNSSIKRKIKRAKRRVMDFWTGFKKFVLTASVIGILIFVAVGFTNKDTRILSSWQIIGCFEVIEDVIDRIKDITDDAGQFLSRILAILRTVDSSLNGSDNENAVQLEDIPAYTGEPYVVIRNNNPSFTKEEIKRKSYEYYSELDLLGRCGVTMACIGRDIMPTEERGPIGMVKPSGWKLKKYDIVDGKYIYNRCHLIGYQLTGENANVKNLITGTRYMNVEGMLPFENKVAEYVKKTGNHVMYRVTPIFEENNLVASGVHMEAYSVEDKGIGISFNVFVYNVQPGIKIDYLTGDNWLAQ